MDAPYDLHEVSTKIALYSHDGEKVLVMVYPARAGLHGLPGGHLDAGELPAEALVRELDEELGVSIDTFEKKSFFLRNGDKGSVILAYIGTAPVDLVLNPSDPVKEFAVWMDADEIQLVENMSDEYKKFVAENWPTK
jgi:ADP-ribose pyrophosphatase YjhB (NUDIX family)